MARMSDDRIRCSFCGKTGDQVRKMISGPSGIYICDECVELCAELIEEELGQEELDRSPEEINLLKPKEIKEFLDEYVIGQEEAKKVLSVAVYNITSGSLPWRIRRTRCGTAEKQYPDAGSHRFGKDRCWRRRWARLLNVPFAIADATS